MNKENAAKILDDTFGHSYNEVQFLNFINELFNGFDVNQKEHSIPNAFKDYVDTYKQFGTYIDGSGDAVDVLAIKLKRTTSRDRARTMQRNFVAKHLSEKNNSHAALVAFYDDNLEDWRFSFVKLDYHLEKDDYGKVKPVEDLTPAKRYSYLVGINEPNHTCRTQFLELIKESKINPSIEKLEGAFSIEKVTDEFFEEYKKLYLKLKEALEGVLEKDSRIRDDFINKEISTADFAKKLLGQIVFLYFLQKKGWLGVERDEATGKFNEWGSGRKKFLTELVYGRIVDYENRVGNPINFFNDILEPLFYRALAVERDDDDDYYEIYDYKCKIPFLNGGLFEPINDYNWKETDILLDNLIFKEIIDTFDEFNFTVKEDEPLEKEVAVDPEMLGEIFQKLLPVKDRKSKGAFYTPREIVHYMCQQSLINYLEVNTKNKDIPRDDIEKFIRFGDDSSSVDQNHLIKIEELQQRINSGEENVAKLEEQLYYNFDELTLPKSIKWDKDNRKFIDKLLADVKVVDPAVGSGAFPVGMMNEIVKARSTLALFLYGVDSSDRKTYNLKRETIQNCLYGVDIDSSAVDITKLRFWLSLIVDEDDRDKIEPLPNLDYKIMCGNSLLEDFEGVKLFDEQLLKDFDQSESVELKRIDNEIEELQHKFNDEFGDEFGETYKNGSKEYIRQNEINRKLNKLKREKKAIRSNIKNNPQQSTFDSVLEYRIKESHKKLAEFKRLRKAFFDECGKKRKKELVGDIDNILWGLVEETLKEQGHEDAMQKLAQYKKNKSKPFFLWKLYFFEVFQKENYGFDIVIGNPPYGADISKKDMHCLKYRFKDNVNINSAAIFIDFAKNYWLNKNGTLSFIVPKSLLYSKRWFKLVESMLGNVSILVDVEKAFKKVKLEQVVFVYNRSLHTDYYIARKFLDNLFLFSTKISNIVPLKLKAWVCGITSNELRVYTNLNIDYVQMSEISTTKRGVGFQKYLSDCGNIPVIGGRNIFKYGINGNKGYLSSGYINTKSEKVEFMSQPKIISQDIIAHIQNPQPHIKITSFFDANGQLFGLDTVQNTIISDSNFDYNYILALLNSKFVSWYTYKFIYCCAIRTMHFDNNYIGKIIIPTNEKRYCEPIITTVKQILAITKDSDYLENPNKQSKVKALESQIDQLVYKLYDLTPEEIAIVEGFNEGK